MDSINHVNHRLYQEPFFSIIVFFGSFCLLGPGTGNTQLLVGVFTQQRKNGTGSDKKGTVPIIFVKEQ